MGKQACIVTNYIALSLIILCRAHDNDADQNGSEDLNEGNDPKDANPLSIQDQISELSATLVEHSQALDALKQVPNILANLSQSLGLSNEPADEFHGEQQDELYSDPQFQSDDENDLLAKFNGNFQLKIAPYYKFCKCMRALLII